MRYQFVLIAHYLLISKCEFRVGGRLFLQEEDSLAIITKIWGAAVATGVRFRGDRQGVKALRSD